MPGEFPDEPRQLTSGISNRYEAIRGKKLLWWAGIIVLTSAMSLGLFVGLIVALPQQYFAQSRNLWVDRHPVVRWLGIIAKNLLGLVIVALGVVLSLPGIPGQGLLTILIGLVLLDFPAKHQLVLSIVRRPGVLASMNRLRQLFRRPPLIV